MSSWYSRIRATALAICFCACGGSSGSGGNAANSPAAGQTGPEPATTSATPRQQGRQGAAGPEGLAPGPDRGGAAASGVAGPGAAAEATVHDALRAAVASELRPVEDQVRDAVRKPYEVLQFFGIRPGMTVADMMAGSGYYTEILSRAVGHKGRVYTQNNKFVLERFAEKPLSARLAHPDMANVTRLDRELEDLGLPAGKLDAVLMILFYHDTYWMNVDRVAMNRAIFDSLKPGGIFGVIDHRAQSGSGARDVKTLHRVDAEQVKKELLAVGFELDSESDLLSHPGDDRTSNVFAPDIRGKTDRFIYRFRKPRPVE
ncbi:MAG: SAM-dependent methyltransferase [Proteobacteria bacterium]|nr:SAM-dependent methyltransferase [Pseudomonadota bacterium]